MAMQGQSSAANGPPAGVVGPSSKSSPAVTSQQAQQQQSQQAQQQAQGNNFEPLDKSSSNTLKRNPKMELCKTDLLKLLGYLEGELQARDIVIAALKSEKMKHLLNSRYRSGTSDPHCALARDTALVGGASNSQGIQGDQLGATLEALVTRQRYMKSHMARVMQSAEMRHRTVIKELEEERQKHKNEHETVQSDDVAYNLEKELTRLKKELETEKQEKKQLETELKNITDTLEEEKKRHKKIILTLLAERKNIIMKHIEERKRSEDLAQLLSEEKVRTDTMAEGLEEESKKALLMEAEMEKQQAQIEVERSQHRQAIAMKDKKLMEQNQELEKLRTELEAAREQQARSGSSVPIRAALLPAGVTPPPPPAKPAGLAAMGTIRAAAAPPSVKGAVLGAGTPMVSSKVVQPTATVSSVPVSGPTTGIARSVTPGQALRGAVFGANVEGVVVGPAQDSAVSAAQALPKRPASSSAVPPPPVPGGGGGGIVASSTALVAPKKPAVAVPMSQPPGGGAGPAPGIVARGAPPPVPPNKPVVPPKKEVAAAFLRRAESAATEPHQVVAKQFVKQNTVVAGTVGVGQSVTGPSPAVAPVVIANANAAAVHAAVVDDEIKPR